MSLTTPTPKPTILKNTGTKLLVAILCLLSFLAGYYAHQSRQMNYCQSIDQKFKIEQGVVVCLIDSAQ